MLDLKGIEARKIETEKSPKASFHLSVQSAQNAGCHLADPGLLAPQVCTIFCSPLCT
jgi:hypothetical protein